MEGQERTGEESTTWNKAGLVFANCACLLFFHIDNRHHNLLSETSFRTLTPLLLRTPPVKHPVCIVTKEDVDDDMVAECGGGGGVLPQTCVCAETTQTANQRVSHTGNYGTVLYRGAL